MESDNPTENAHRPSLTRRQQRLVSAAVAIREDPPQRIDYLHSVQCQCGLPYRNPGPDVRDWDRHQGVLSMRVEAGSALNPQTGEFVHLGLPFGEKPRLVLIHLAGEAIRTLSPVIDVEDSMTAFARSLGMDTNGPSLRKLKDQLARLAAATIRFGMIANGKAIQVNTQIVGSFDLWFPLQADQRVLWPSTVRLTTEYFESLTRHAVPLDRRAIAALAASSMALDVYAWLAQRLHRIAYGKPAFLTWPVVQEQFGNGFSRLRDFRRTFLRVLRQVQAVYPQATVTADGQGLTLHHSRPPVTRPQLQVPVQWG